MITNSKYERAALTYERMHNDHRVSVLTGIKKNGEETDKDAINSIVEKMHK